MAETASVTGVDLDTMMNDTLYMEARATFPDNPKCIITRLLKRTRE